MTPTWIVRVDSAAGQLISALQYGSARGAERAARNAVASGYKARVIGPPVTPRRLRQPAPAPVPRPQAQPGHVGRG
jgi:hypothetical protein